MKSKIKRNKDIITVLVGTYPPIEKGDVLQCKQLLPMEDATINKVHTDNIILQPKNGIGYNQRADKFYNLEWEITKEGETLGGTFEIKELGENDVIIY